MAKGARSSKKQRKEHRPIEDSEPEETFSRSVKIVVTNSRESGDQWGPVTNVRPGMTVTNTTSDDTHWVTRTQSVEVQPGSSTSKSGLLKMFSKKGLEKEDLICIEEGDDGGSVETGLEPRTYDVEEAKKEFEDANYKYDMEELQTNNGGASGFLSSFFNSKKLVEPKDEAISIEEADDGSVETGFENDKNKYDVNALRVPSMMDQAREDDQLGYEDDILEDPYDEISPRKEPMPKDEEGDIEGEKRGEKRRFLIGMSSKLLFLLGSMLFLILAVHDYQRVNGSAPAANGVGATNPQDVPEQTAQSETLQSPDDDVDPFITAGPNTPTITINVHDLEDELAMEEAQKEERAGAVTASHTWSTRRRTQTNWYTKYWDSLPEDVKTAAGLLGYDQDKWNNAKPVYTDRLHWHELTKAQQEAAYLVFGYEEETWNEYVDRFLANLQNPSPAPTPPPTAKPTDSPKDESTAGAGGGKPEDVGGQPEGTATAKPTDSPKDESTVGAGGDKPDDVGGQPEGTGGQPESTGGKPEDSGDKPEGVGENPEGYTTNTTTMYEGEETGGLVGSQTHQSDGNFSVGEGEDPWTVSALNTDDSDGQTSTEPRGQTFKTFYVFAAVCFVLVGMLDAMHQQLGFHGVMVLAGITGIMAGAFSSSNDMAFNVCHSLSSHFFFLQAILVMYSRLLLTYDTSVRRILNFADGLFIIGALMNVVVSYLRYGGMTMVMAKTSLAASVFWVVAAIIYVTITLMFWRRRNKTWKQTGTTSGEVSIQDSCNVIEELNDDGCEISLAGK